MTNSTRAAALDLKAMVDPARQGEFKGDRWVTLTFRRHQTEAKQFANTDVKLKWDNDWRFDRVFHVSYVADGDPGAWAGLSDQGHR